MRTTQPGHALGRGRAGRKRRMSLRAAMRSPTPLPAISPSLPRASHSLDDRTEDAYLEARAEKRTAENSADRLFKDQDNTANVLRLLRSGRTVPLSQLERLSTGTRDVPAVLGR